MPVANGVPTCDSLVQLGNLAGFTVADCGVTPPPPPPGSVALSAVQMWQVNASITTVQAALTHQGFSTVADGYFGPGTKAQYSLWQQSLGFTGADASGFPGVSSLTTLGSREGFTVTNDGGVPAGEPAENYTRFTYNGSGGTVVNQRTANMLALAVTQLADSYSWTPYLTQGSYHPGTASSAGTHDGGGVVDIRVTTMTENGRFLLVQALREVGFAAWYRTPAEGFDVHCHAVAIGDWEMSPEAADQVQQYFNGTNGLANHAADTLPSGYPVVKPTWVNKYNR